MWGEYKYYNPSRFIEEIPRKLLEMSTFEGRSQNSSTFRDAVYKGSGLKRSNMKEDLSEYATKNAAEFFAEAFAEYMTSPNPRPLAIRFGKMLDEVMKEYE